MEEDALDLTLNEEESYILKWFSLNTWIDQEWVVTQSYYNREKTCMILRNLAEKLYLRDNEKSFFK